MGFKNWFENLELQIGDFVKMSTSGFGSGFATGRVKINKNRTMHQAMFRIPNSNKFVSHWMPEEHLEKIETNEIPEDLYDFFEDPANRGMWIELARTDQKFRKFI